MLPSDTITGSARIVPSVGKCGDDAIPAPGSARLAGVRPVMEGVRRGLTLAADGSLFTPPFRAATAEAVFGTVRGMLGVG